MSTPSLSPQRLAIRRARRRLFIWPLCFLIAVSTILFLLMRPASPTEQQAAGPVVGQVVPGFTLPTLAGTRAGPSQFRGHPLFLQFWAVNCTSCAHERLGLLKASAPFVRQGGIALGVDAYLETPGMVRAYLKSRREPYTTILLDPNGAVVFGKYHVIGVPTSLFIDRQGIVRRVVIGEMSERSFQDAFRQLLK
ncbi:MAG TPA: TlpA disulfide reductase family protein [Chloroflexota bacterium]|nr:TlpA disulfide reductase family protein [Chloroflexota bacterium]